jgi:hypothetical protein
MKMQLFDRNFKSMHVALAAAWRSGHRIRLKSKTRVRIQPGYKVFKET